MNESNFYVIRFRPTAHSESQVIGALRFTVPTTYEQRMDSLRVWAAEHRKHKPTLDPTEWMWLDDVTVYDATIVVTVKP